MIKEAIGTGATIEEAIAQAVAMLAAPDDVDVKHDVLELPKKKTLGLFGGNPAKVRAYYEYEEAPVVKEKAPKAPKAPATKPAPKAPAAKPAPKAVAEKAPAVKVEADPAEFANAEKYLRGILAGMGVEDVKISFSIEDETVQIQLDCGSNQGTVIGRRGETLDAIQYLVRLIINKESDAYKRVSINVGSYRQKREETLRELAKKNAERVRKYGRNVVLDPMNPYERRVVHTAIQEIEGVNSHSVGSDSERRVVITLAEGFTAENGSAPHRDGGRGGRGGRGGYRGGNKGKSSANTQPSRPPRSDKAGASLYGKIEPKAAQPTNE